MTLVRDIYEKETLLLRQSLHVKNKSLGRECVILEKKLYFFLFSLCLCYIFIYMTAGIPQHFLLLGVGRCFFCSTNDRNVSSTSAYFISLIYYENFQDTDLFSSFPLPGLTPHALKNPFYIPNIDV